MAPWIGTYSVASMLPNKAVVAATGILASAMIRRVLDRMATIGASRSKLMSIAMVLSIAVGTVWSYVLIIVFGHAHIVHASVVELSAAGPQFAGPAYHALVLLTWSFGYLGLVQPQSAEQRVASTAERHAMPPNADGNADGSVAAQPPPLRLMLRDGRRSILLEADEIDWVQADGDYVRVRTGRRTLILRDTLTRLGQVLPDAIYARIHRSTIVNVRRIREVVGQPNRDCVVVLADGARLKGSRTYTEALRVRLSDAVSKEMVR